MRILVTWASLRGGTAGIAQIIADDLERRGFEVAAVPCDEVDNVGTFDAVILGGALYANRWPKAAARFVSKNVRTLRKVPVWFFSSGPLDDSASQSEIPATKQIELLGERIGVKGHATFGGRLAPDARGFPASAMAKTMSGDWRNPDRIIAWAADVAAELPTATPGEPIDHPARSLRRLIAYGIAGWMLCSAAMGVLIALTSLTAAIVLHAIAAPIVFTAIAMHYFSTRGAREPLPTAFTWMAIVLALDVLIVAGVVQRSFAMFGSIWGTWLPLGLIMVATWTTGFVMSMMPQAQSRQAIAPRRVTTNKP